MHSGEPCPTRFVILAAPRTGSNMLCTLLNSHSAILCHHELFNPEDIFYSLPLRDGSFTLGTIEERDSDPAAFLDRVWKNGSGHECIGFKLTHRQNETVFYKVLRDPDVKKIILRRRNRVKTFVSWLIAQKTGQWEVYSKSRLTPLRQKVNVDPQALEDHIAFNDAYYAEMQNNLENSGQSYLRTLYEDLFFAEERLRILNYLGVSPDLSQLKVESVKQTTDDLRDLISNFSELEKELNGLDVQGDLYSATSETSSPSLR